MLPLRLLGKQLPQISAFCRAALPRVLTARRCLSGTTAEEEQDRPLFSGCRADYTDRLSFINPDETPGIPVYRVLSRGGQAVAGGRDDPNLDKETLVKMYKTMTQLNVMDRLLYQSQRQGRISFYMTHFGEEGILLGSAAALNDKDVVWGQYREAGVLMWRGFTLDQFIGQCYGNLTDAGKGKQMPVHYGSKELNFVTISSPLATQICQASGYGYKLKMENLSLPEKDRRIAVCFFGDGAASEGDFHAGMNFAATLGCQVLFICRNNGYAISTPVSDQYRGDGIAARGPGYGMLTARVDGNDPLAVYNAVRDARKAILDQSRPVLLETMSYRVGHHSTSDDSTTYRSTDEVNRWEKSDSPIGRFRAYLIAKQMWSPEEDLAWAKVARKNVLEAMTKAERIEKWNPMEMFNDVYENGPSDEGMPKALKDQRAELREHLNKYGQHYAMQQFAPIPPEK